MNGTALKEKARELGADLIGIAPINRFKTLSSDRNPAAIAPECRSVIVLGRRILRGSLRGVEEGTSFGSTYRLFGFTWLEDNFLSQTSYDLTCWIEEQGFEAVPLFGYHDAGMPKGLPVSPDKPAPNVYVDMEFAAQAAGLGEMGLCDVFLSPEYGPRQRFAVILTDAELEADPISDKTVCGDCEACIAACPFSAIDATSKRKVGVPGHEMEVASIDYAVCRSCPNGAMTGPGRGSRPDRVAAACVRACIDRLEKGEKCSNRFEQPFRKRTPWALDTFRRAITPSDDAKNPAAIGCGTATVNTRKA